MRWWTALGSLRCFEKSNDVALWDIGGFEEEGVSESTGDRGTIGRFLI